VIPVTIYSRPGCHLCDDMKLLVKHVGKSFDFAFEEIDISQDPALEQLYGMEIPVLFVAGKKVAKYRISERDLLRILTERAGGPGTAGGAG
jgi:glutaredoxin